MNIPVFPCVLCIHNEQVRVEPLQPGLHDILKARAEYVCFVQADPIRSPARAQDLILRHRVHGYRAGDLERQYASLEVEEDYLYAYGFLSKPVWQLLHPRKTPPLRALEKKVLETVTRLGEAHPRALESHLGKRRHGDDACAGVASLAGIAADRAARERHQGVPPPRPRSGQACVVA